MLYFPQQMGQLHRLRSHSTASRSTASWGATWSCSWKRSTPLETTALHTTRALLCFTGWPGSSWELVRVSSRWMWRLWVIPFASWIWRSPRWLDLHFTQDRLTEKTIMFYLSSPPQKERRIIHPAAVRMRSYEQQGGRSLPADLRNRSWTSYVLSSWDYRSKKPIGHTQFNFFSLKTFLGLI